MNFNNHSDLKGKHAFLGASTYSWINYDEDKLVQKLDRSNRVILGTALHDYSCDKIKLRIKVKKNKKQLKDEIKLHMMSKGHYSDYVISSVDKLPDEVFATLTTYINEAIDFNMTPETILYYSENCFGTCDAISFDGNMLRIHDLKTGATPAHMEQLIVYAALFCLEYLLRPGDISIELRLYQNNEVIFFNPTVEDIAPIMDKIVSFDNILNNLKMGGSEDVLF